MTDPRQHCYAEGKTMDLKDQGFDLGQFLDDLEAASSKIFDRIMASLPLLDDEDLDRMDKNVGPYWDAIDEIREEFLEAFESGAARSWPVTQRFLIRQCEAQQAYEAAARAELKAISREKGIPVDAAWSDPEVN